MGQRRRRSSGENYNRNERNIKNSREVSRRSKGKDRYAYEEEYYDSRNRSSRRYAGYPDMDEEQKYRSSKSVKKIDKKNKKRVKRRGRRKNLPSKILGMIFAILQFVLSVVFLVNIFFFDILTPTYMMVLGAVLLILLGITLLSQIGTRGKGIPGKIFSFLLCAILAAGSFGIGMMQDVMNEMTGKNTKTSAVCVAVKADDAAETIIDAKGYTYGVSYGANADQLKTTISKLETELGGELQLTEYESVIEQAQALYDGEIQAMIYKEGQTSIVKEQFETFEEDIKVIYTHNITIEIENQAVSANMSEPFAVYLSGIDTYGDISKESRSDVNIIAVVNPTSHQILLVTTPRDYYVTIPGISGGSYDKLTHAGLYGVDASMRTLENLYGTEIKFFGRVNFSSMIDIVDALGGLDVESDAAFTTTPNAGKVINVKEGMNHFGGREALAFCRERKNLPDGDNARGRHQQAVITAIIKKMMSPAMLRGAADIIKSVSDGIDTNFSMDQIQELVKMQLRTNATWYITSVQAKGFGGKNTCYSSGSTMLYVTMQDSSSVAEISAMIDRVEAGELLEGSEATME